MIKLYLACGFLAADSSEHLFGVNTSAAVYVCNIRSAAATVAFAIHISANFYGKLLLFSILLRNIC